MTEDEQRHQKAMLLLEHQEAEQELAALREKSLRLSYLTQAFAEWMEDAARNKTSITSNEIYSSKLGRKVNIPGDGAFKAAMDYESALSLVREIQEAEKRTENLRNRKQALGLK